MRTIAPGVLYLNRIDWGANPRYPKRGNDVARTKRKHVTFHHTVIVDSDDSPNVWEKSDDIKGKMRQLQVIRAADLGTDVPYSFVIFLMADGSITVCEGRGYDRSGAHTKGHNTDGIGISFEGNFELAGADVRRWIPKVNQFLGHLKFQAGMKYLATRPHAIPGSRVIHGHRDFSSTACPGANLFKRLHEFAFVRPGGSAAKEDLDVATAEKLQNQINVLIKSANVQQTQLDHHKAQITYLSEIAVGLKKLIDESKAQPSGGAAAAVADLVKSVEEIEQQIEENRQRISAAADEMTS